MTLLFVIITLVFTLFVIYKAAEPFLGSREAQLRTELLDDELRSIELLVARKTALVQSLREIEYDWQTNKIAEDDYNRFKKSYERQAVGIMRRLDAIHGGRTWEQSINEELTRRLNSNHEKALPPEAADISTPAENHLDASTPAHASELTCESCDKPLRPEDIFCARCGHRAARNSETADAENSKKSPEVTSINQSLRPEITQ